MGRAVVVLLLCLCVTPCLADVGETTRISNDIANAADAAAVQQGQHSDDPRLTTWRVQALMGVGHKLALEPEVALSFTVVLLLGLLVLPFVTYGRSAPSDFLEKTPPQTLLNFFTSLVTLVLGIAFFIWRSQDDGAVATHVFDLYSGLLWLFVLPAFAALVFQMIRLRNAAQQDNSEQQLCDFSVPLSSCNVRDAAVVASVFVANDGTKNPNTWELFYSCDNDNPTQRELAFGYMVVDRDPNTHATFLGRGVDYVVSGSHTHFELTNKHLEFEPCHTLRVWDEDEFVDGSPDGELRDCSEGNNCQPPIPWHPELATAAAPADPKHPDRAQYRLTVLSRKPITIKGGKAAIVEDPASDMPTVPGLELHPVMRLSPQRPYTSMAFETTVSGVAVPTTGRWLLFEYYGEFVPEDTEVSYRTIALRIDPKCFDGTSAESAPAMGLSSSLLKCTEGQEQVKTGEAECTVACPSMGPATSEYTALVHGNCRTELMPVESVVRTKLCRGDLRPQLVDAKALCPLGFSPFSGGALCCHAGKALSNEDSRQVMLWSEDECDDGTVIRCPWPAGCSPEAKDVQMGEDGVVSAKSARELRKKGLDATNKQQTGWVLSKQD